MAGLVKGGRAREGLLGHGWMSDLPLNSDLQHSWHLEIMSNNIVPGWLGGLCDAGALNPARPWHYTERLQPDETWGALKCFFYFFRRLSKWAWERAVSSAVSQSVYRHGWLITEREIYGYNEGENRPRVKSCRCAPLCVCLCCLMSRSRKSQEEEGRGRARK